MITRTLPTSVQIVFPSPTVLSFEHTTGHFSRWTIFVSHRDTFSHGRENYDTVTLTTDNFSTANCRKYKSCTETTSNRSQTVCMANQWGNEIHSQRDYQIIRRHSHPLQSIVTHSIRWWFSSPSKHPEAPSKLLLSTSATKKMTDKVQQAAGQGGQQNIKAVIHKPYWCPLAHHNITPMSTHHHHCHIYQRTEIPNPTPCAPMTHLHIEEPNHQFGDNISDSIPKTRHINWYLLPISD